MEEITLSKLNMDDDVLLLKVKSDLKQGVQIDSYNLEETQVTQVWTDSPNWQFMVAGLSSKNEDDNILAVEIQSIGLSKLFIKLHIDLSKNSFKVQFQKLSEVFAQIDMVSIEEASEFIDAYMISTFNRTLTGKLFNNLAYDKNYFHWLKP